MCRQGRKKRFTVSITGKVTLTANHLVDRACRIRGLFFGVRHRHRQYKCGDEAEPDTKLKDKKARFAGLF